MKSARRRRREGVTAKGEEDTRVLGNVMKGPLVASIMREPTDELDAAHVAFLVDTRQEEAMERVIENLAHGWRGWIDVRLLGPMAAYDFVGTAHRELIWTC